MGEETVGEIDLLEKYGLRTLSGADLSRADLSHCDLSGADLSGANLSGADLHEANLCGANLSRTILTGVDLHEANLSGANLSGALLFGVDLCKANLSGADLPGVDLCKANLSGADLSGADLSGVDLCKANLSGANLLGVQGLASMKEEMEMLILLREQIRQEAFEFDMSHWHGEAYPDISSFESFLNTCGTTHCSAGFCQAELARRKNPLALISAEVAGSYAIPSMVQLFTSSKEEFTEHLDKLISGECPLLQR